MQFTWQLEYHSNPEFCSNLERYEAIRCGSDAIKMTTDRNTATEVHLIACLNFLTSAVGCFCGLVGGVVVEGFQGINAALPAERSESSIIYAAV